MSKNKKRDLLESSVERLGRILSKKWDIKVVFGSSVPVTTGKVIYLPTIPDDATEDFLKVVQGYLDHETAHILFTDFEVLKTILNEEKKFYLLVNAIEDSRIEREYIRVWPGAVSNLKVSLEWALMKMVQLNHFTDPKHPEVIQKTNRWEELSSLSKLIYVSTIYPQVHFDKDHWFIRDFVDAETLYLIEAVEPLLKEAIEFGGNTAKVIEIARKIMDFWKSQQKDESPKSKPPHKPSPGTQPTKGGVNTFESPIPPSESETYEKLTNLKQLIKEEIDKSLQSSPPKYAVYTTAGDVVEKMKDGDKALYRRFVQDANSMVYVIKKKLSRALLSVNLSGWERNKISGRLDSRMAYKVALGTSNKVFKERITGEAYDTAVMLMIDHSGSMSGDRLKLAAHTSIIMGEVLNSIGIPFSVAGFSTGDPHVPLVRKQKATQQDLDIYTRWGDLWIGVYKDFDESWQHVNHRLGRMPRNGHANTYDGESLRWGAKQLLQRPEKRKILFWLNDGEPTPCVGESIPAHISYTSSSAKDVESVVELIAVGINSGNVKRYYSNHIVVGSLQDLPKLCITELDALLRKTKGEGHGVRRR